MKKWPSDTPFPSAQKGVSNPALRLLSGASTPATPYQNVITAITPPLPPVSVPLPTGSTPLAGVRQATINYGLEGWLRSLAFAGQSPMTLRGKADAVDKLIWWMKREGKVECNTITVMEFVEYLRHSHNDPSGRCDKPRERKELSARTVQLYVKYLRSYFRFIVIDQVMAYSVPEDERAAAWQIAHLPVPSAPKRVIAPLTVDEIGRLFNAAIEHSRVKERDLALLWFLLETGVRIAEACALRVVDFNLTSGQVEVLGKGKKRRQVLFGDDTARVLASYWQKWNLTGESPAFCAHWGQQVGGSLTTNAALKIFQRLRNVCNIPGKRVSPHTLRHSFATLFIQGGGSDRVLQMLLGHETREMTDHYVHLSELETARSHKYSPARAVLESLHNTRRQRR